MNRIDNRTRRDFLRVAGAGTAASLVYLGGAGSDPSARAGARAPGQPSFQLAMASYTLRKFDLATALAMTRRVGLKAICLKSFHLPLDASPDEIAQAAAQVNEAGIVLYGGGVITMRNAPQVDQAFEYAKAAGMTKIIAAPSAETLPLIEKKVKQYNVAVCIHNHGPGDKHFPTPEAAYEKIKDLDPRIGLCHDIGHTLRYGADPVAQTRACADRLLDVHMKDVTEATPKGHATPCGRGVIDLPRMIQTFIDVGYSGYLSFEYEAEPEDPLPGLAESVGYVRGVMDALSVGPAAAVTSS